MVTVTEKIADVTRQVVWLLKLYIDQCNNEYSEGACTAAGGQCYFTWATCEDTANYDKGTRIYQFVNRGAPYVQGALPYLLTPIEHAPTEIKPDKFNVEKGKMTFELANDDALPTSDPTKTTAAADSGKFWFNFLARNPNYHGRKAELYLGFDGVAAANYQLYWAGRIEDINYTKHGVKIICVDRLYQAAEKTAPKKISDDNTVQDTTDLGGDTEGMTDAQVTLIVTDIDEFYDATANWPQTIKIDDEYITYTGKNSGNETLTGLTRGAFGTTAATHLNGTEISQVIVYSDDDGVAWGDCSGWSADWIFLDLICNRLGVDAAYIATVDESVTLAEDLDDSETVIDLNNLPKLPERGVIYVGTEMIAYTGKTSSAITGCKRGSFGTTAAAGSTDDPVYIPAFTHELGRWHQESLYGGRFNKEEKISKLIHWLSESTLADVFPNEDGDIDCKMQAPAWQDSDITELTGNDFLDGRKINRNEESRITQAWIHYLGSEDAGSDETDYQGLDVYVGANEESDNNYGEARQKVIYAKFIKRQTEATWLAAHYFTRYRTACPIQEFEVELYHNALGVGGLVNITTDEIVDATGSALTKTYRIVRKVVKGLNRIALKVIDSGFSGKKYAVIAPTTVVDDYDDASSSDKAKYAWIADSNNYLGAADDDAYYIY